jgi:hypothetical protein
VAGGEIMTLKNGDHCRYEGTQFACGHAVVRQQAGDQVTIDLDHVGEVTVPVGDVTVQAFQDPTDD